MPGIGGPGLYERVKTKSPELIDSIIFITGDTVNPATEDFLSGVTNPVPSKPFGFWELEQLVVGIINRPKGGDEPITGRAGPDAASV